jgi:DNA-binding MarR family transcriptional regulator
MAERVVARHLQEAGVSGEQLALLSLIATVEPITPTALAAELGVPLTTLADALRRLDARGELERSPNPADQRSHLITLSGEGRARLEAVEPQLRKAADELSAELRLPPDEVSEALDDLHGALRTASARSARSAVRESSK